MDALTQLQEEQKKKFARIKMRQAKQSAENDLSSKSSTFGVSDDLNLNVGDVSTSSAVGLNVTLEAANTALQQDLRELKDETGRLRKALAERDYEIKRLNKKIVKSEDEKRMLADAGLATDSASTKIVDLSKKNRELTSQFESEKSKAFRLQQKVSELERKLMFSSQETGDGMKSQKSSLNRSLSPSRSSLTSDKADALQEQLNSANLKISEYRNQIQSLKQDLKVAHKVLSQETGEDTVTIQSLLNSNGQGFRGRAQQVIALQGKVKDLEQKLKTDLDLNPKVDKNAMRIKTIERTRKEQYDNLKNDLVELQEQNVEVQRKWDATKARNKVLASEIKSLKSQLTVLSEKGSHDNELIETLMKQQENLQKLLERSSAVKENVRKEYVVNNDSNYAIQQESNELKRLKELLVEKECRIKDLEDKVIRTTDSLDASHTPLTVFSSAKRENSDISLSSSDLDDATLRRKYTEMKALYDACEAERQQLTRMVVTFNQRNDDLMRKHEQVISNYHELKRKFSNLEQHIDTVKNNERSSTARESSRVVAADFESQLAIQKDENNALKEALETTLRNKQNDITMYQEMNQQTKQVFLDALKTLTSKQ